MRRSVETIQRSCDTSVGTIFSTSRSSHQSANTGDDLGGTRTFAVAVREAVMDYAACNVVYVDRTAREDKLVTREDSSEKKSDFTDGHAPTSPPETVDANLLTLLDTFSEGMSRDNPRASQV